MGPVLLGSYIIFDIAFLANTETTVGGVEVRQFRPLFTLFLKKASHDAICTGRGLFHYGAECPVAFIEGYIWFTWYTQLCGMMTVVTVTGCQA